MSTLVEDHDVHDNIIEAEKIRTKGFNASSRDFSCLILLITETGYMLFAVAAATNYLTFNNKSGHISTFFTSIRDLNLVNTI